MNNDFSSFGVEVTDENASTWPAINGFNWFGYFALFFFF